MLNSLRLLLSIFRSKSSLFFLFILLGISSIAIGQGSVTLSYNYGSPLTLTVGTPIMSPSGQPSISPGSAQLTNFMSSPTLPSGLTLNNTTGVISGTPSSTQTMMNYTITAVNSSDQTTVTTSLSITVNASGGSSSSTVTYYSVASGPWNTSSTWSLTSNGAPISSGYPGFTDNVIIEGGKTVEISGSGVIASSITIKSGSVLSALTANNVSATSGIVVNPGGALIGSSANISATVRLQQNVVGQRGWRLFANPFSSPQNIASIALSNGITIGTSISGNITSTDLKTFSGTWTNVTTTSLMPTVGEYALFIRGLASEVTGSNYTGGPTGFTYNVSGSLNSASLTRSQSSGVFRIIGNPYAAPINTSALTGQISNVPYYTYKISVTGSPTVKSGSWVAVPGSSLTTTLPVLGVLCYLPSSSSLFNISTSDINITGTLITGLFSSETPLQIMELTLNKGQDFADKLFIRSDFNATSNGNDKIDLPKYQNETTNFYSVSPDKTQLSVDTRNEWNQTIPLGLKTPVGNYNISIQNNTLSVGKSIYLKDNYLNQTTLLKAGTVYNFSVSNDSLSQGDKRFELQFGLSTNTLPTDESLNSGLRLKVIGTVLKGNLLTIEVGGLKVNEVGQVVLLDMNGRLLKSKAVINGLNQINIDELSKGMQLIKLSNGKDQLVKKFIKD
jgi:hypothetical protein